MSALRDYQIRALEKTRAAYRAGKRSICNVMPTGSGKTRLGAEFAAAHLAKGGQIVWLAHRTELVQQAAERLRSEGMSCVGVLSATESNPQPGARIHVASVQTLIARNLRPEASLVVFDECHHYIAAEWNVVAEHYSHAVRLGLTATPQRSDGKPLGDLFDAIVVGATPRELTDAGYLVPCDIVGPRRYMRGRIVGSPVEKYLEHAAGRRAFVFCATVEQAQETTQAFRDAEVPAACVHADTPRDERQAAVEAFRAGDLLVLVNVYVFTEGTDVPEAEVCLLARGASCASTYLQMVGRVLRPAPGKDRALLIDLMGLAHRHGAPTDERIYSLEGKAIRLASGGGGGMGNGGAKRPQQIAGALARIASGTPDYVKKREFLQHMYTRAHQRGFKPGWAIHRFRERFGHLPWESAA